MKRIILCVLAVLLACSSWGKCLRLTLSDGTLVYYQLGGEKNPMLRVGENGYTIETDHYSFDGEVSFKILNEDAPTDLYRANDSLQSTKPVKFYQLDGKVVDASDLVPGQVYLMKTETSTVKITKQ